MLNNVFRVVIPGGEVGLQVFFEIVLYAMLLNKFEDLQGVCLPVGCFGHGKVVDAANFVKINDFAYAGIGWASGRNDSAM
jgi:hypothetical protein